MAQETKVNIVESVIRRLTAGFWPSGKEIKEALDFLEKQEVEIARLRRKNEELSAALNPFAKMGAKLSGMKIADPDAEVVGFDRTTVVYADLLHAANVLFGKGEKAPEDH